MVRVCFLLLAVLLGGVACESKSGSGASVPSLSGPAIERNTHPEVIKAGAQLFQTHCAQCHGEMAEGDPQWRKPGVDGRYPAPPLNGSGHAWHHPTSWLKEIIRNGSQPQGNMPAWQEVLSDEEIDAVVAWFQAQWPDQVYAAWCEMQNR